MVKAQTIGGVAHYAAEFIERYIEPWNREDAADVFTQTLDGLRDEPHLVVKVLLNLCGGEDESAKAEALDIIADIYEFCI